MVGHLSREPLKQTANLSSSLNEADLDSAYNSGDDSDDSSKGPLVDDESTASAAMQARNRLRYLDMDNFLVLSIGPE